MIDLRQFLIHNIVQGVFYDPVAPGVANLLSDVAIFDVSGLAPVFVLGALGESITRQTGPRVIAPYVEFSGSYGEVELAIQERIRSLLEARGREAHADEPTAVQATRLQETLLHGLPSSQPLKHIIVPNEEMKARILPHVTVPVGVFGGMSFVLGISEPKFVGHLVTHTKHGLAMLVHGGVVAALLAP